MQFAVFLSVFQFVQFFCLKREEKNRKKRGQGCCLRQISETLNNDSLGVLLVACCHNYGTGIFHYTFVKKKKIKTRSVHCFLYTVLILLSGSDKSGGTVEDMSMS